MDTVDKVLIGVGVLAAGLTALGIYEHYKAPAAPAVLTGTSSATLAPGVMQNVILSLGAGQTYTFSLPAGASFATTQSAFTSDQPSVVPTPTASVSPVVITPMAVGQANLTVNWVNSAGAAQTSTVLITVNA